MTSRIYYISHFSKLTITKQEIVYQFTSMPSYSVMVTSKTRRQPGKGKKQRQHIPHKDRTQEYVIKRNKRERDRVDHVNQAFIKLRDHIPDVKDDSRMSKIGILRSASEYIKSLTSLLNMNELCTPIQNEHNENLSTENKSPGQTFQTSNNDIQSLCIKNSSCMYSKSIQDVSSSLPNDENLILMWLQRQPEQFTLNSGNCFRRRQAS